MHIYKFCQCKKGIQRVAPHDVDFELYSLMVDCDKKELIGDSENTTKKHRKPTKKPKIDDAYDYDSLKDFIKRILDHYF